MSRGLRAGFAFLVSMVLLAIAAPEGRQLPAAGRPLAIEDYYRVQSVGNPSISPDGAWVSFTVATRVEEDNTTRTETWIVAADASVRPWRVLHYGHDVTGARWSDDSAREYAADRQRWRIDPRSPGAVPALVGAAAATGGRG